MNFELVKQVMSEDVQRRAFKAFANQYRTENMLHVVLHVNDYLATDTDSYRIQKSLNTYFCEVDNAVFSRSSNKKLQRFVVIENLKKHKFKNRNKLVNRNHIHIMIEIPRHLNKFMLRDILRSSLNNQICRLEHIATIDKHKHIDNYAELIDYTTKDIQSVKPTQIDKTFDEMNSFVH